MANKLKEYVDKRDFTKTSEPGGESIKSGDSLKFVIQHHMARAEHYDFRLEWEGTMLSWAVPKGPSFDPHDKRLAVKVEDHPLEYRNFEGTIPKGEYGGGTVMIWDEGIWQPLTDVAKGLKKGELKLHLEGKRLRGNWALIKWKSKSDKENDNWLLIKEKDEHVKDSDGISAFDTSVRSGRTMSEITNNIVSDAPENPFQKANAHLARLVDKMPDGDEWVYEVKYDGYRIIAFVENNDVRLMTRNHHDYGSQFSAIKSSLKKFAGGRSMVLDGEVVVLDKSGKSDFQALQNYLKKPGSKQIAYIVFDLLALDGKDLRDRPLRERKEILKDLLQDAPPDLHFSDDIKGGEDILKAACEAGLEGIVGKNIHSAYTGSRDGNWVKIKCGRQQEFVIGGYTLTDKKENGISALLLGVYDKGKLVYAGRAGTGISENESEELLKKFQKLTSDTPHFASPPKERSNEKMTWLKPKIVAEVKFAEWTKNNLLRQASYQGIRIDKNPKDVRYEKAREDPHDDVPTVKKTVKKKDKSGPAVVMGVEITHPEKILFKSPRFTKLDIISYYEKIAPRMLPYLKNRIISAVRCPQGISGSCFYLKHEDSASEFVHRVNVEETSGETDAYFYIKDAAGIIYEAQMNTLEFHTWASQVDQLEQPDVMVFDLDPDTGMDINKVRQGVWDLKEILDELSLVSFLKTSGGKGYHVVVPVKPGVSWDVFYGFAKNIAQVMEAKWPERYTSNVRKEKRKGKIFVDWLRNGRGATSVAPYSIRARKGAKVSMPIGWEELDLIFPDQIGMEEAVARIDQPDPWKDFFHIKQSIK